jgi:hypothetical protein
MSSGRQLLTFTRRPRKASAAARPIAHLLARLRASAARPQVGSAIDDNASAATAPPSPAPGEENVGVHAGALSGKTPEDKPARRALHVVAQPVDQMAYLRSYFDEVRRRVWGGGMWGGGAAWRAPSRATTLHGRPHQEPPAQYSRLA